MENLDQMDANNSNNVVQFAKNPSVLDALKQQISEWEADLTAMPDSACLISTKRMPDQNYAQERVAWFGKGISVAEKIGILEMNKLNLIRHYSSLG